MTSCDTNILAYAFNPDAAEQATAMKFLEEFAGNPRFAISEMVLVEFYNLIRNSSILRAPLSPSRAVELVERLRFDQGWTLLKGAVDVSGQVWRVASTPDFPRRAIFDARLAYSLAAEGVTTFATRNVGDFQRFGVFEVFDPIA